MLLWLFFHAAHAVTFAFWAASFYDYLGIVAIIELMAAPQTFKLRLSFHFDLLAWLLF